MLLENKTAVIYGGGGAVGSGVAEVFAAEGARVYLAGRTQATLDAVAERIRAGGGRAETAVVDAMDEAAVNDHADAVALEAGSLDVAINLTVALTEFGPLLELPAQSVVDSVHRALTTQLLTARAVARHMVRQESGVLLFLGGSDHVNKIPGLGSVQIGMDAMEGLRRQLACDLGPHGVRVISLLTGGILDTLGDGPESDQHRQDLVGQTMLGRGAWVADVGAVAAFLASDKAGTITATQVNISCGAHGD